MKKSFAEQLTEVQESLAVAIRERDEARADSANHSQSTATLQADLQAAKDSLKAEQEAHATDADALQAAAVEINTLKETIKTVEASVAQKVADELTKLGVPPVPAQPSGNATLLETYNAMKPGPEKSAFLAKHAQKLTELSRAK